MISRDLGNNRHSLVVENVSGVELATHTDFDHTNLDVCIVEDGKGCGRQYLERGCTNLALCVCLKKMVLDPAEL